MMVGKSSTSKTLMMVGKSLTSKTYDDGRQVIDQVRHMMMSASHRPSKTLMMVGSHSPSKTYDDVGKSLDQTYDDGRQSLDQVRHDDGRQVTRPSKTLMMVASHRPSKHDDGRQSLDQTSDDGRQVTRPSKTYDDGRQVIDQVRHMMMVGKSLDQVRHMMMVGQVSTSKTYDDGRQVTRPSKTYDDGRQVTRPITRQVRHLMMVAITRPYTRLYEIYKNEEVEAGMQPVTKYHSCAVCDRMQMKINISKDSGEECAGNEKALDLARTNITRDHGYITCNNSSSMFRFATSFTDAIVTGKCNVLQAKILVF
ncbi:hypothetical protein PR048_032046 [Dryococelus australis]|uniref:Uncharacterized protein n=1 Tax=Dryococelus australis TaxID=614101 RepID=A0ABQ9G717_9NEOP|nr:hypothetical protein PR048_032046 [Dryococelus australis]